MEGYSDKENYISILPEYKVKYLIKYSIDLFKKGHTEMHISSSGSEIGKLVVVTECLKTEIEGLFQNYSIDSKVVENDIIPFMKVVLRTNPFKILNYGFYKNPLPENLRRKLYSMSRYGYGIRLNEGQVNKEVINRYRNSRNEFSSRLSQNSYNFKNQARGNMNLRGRGYSNFRGRNLRGGRGMRGGYRRNLKTNQNNESSFVDVYESSTPRQTNDYRNNYEDDKNNVSYHNDRNYNTNYSNHLNKYYEEKPYHLKNNYNDNNNHQQNYIQQKSQNSNYNFRFNNQQNNQYKNKRDLNYQYKNQEERTYNGFNNSGPENLDNNFNQENNNYSRNHSNYQNYEEINDRERIQENTRGRGVTRGRGNGRGRGNRGIGRGNY